MTKLGDLVKKILSPFVRHTKYENCGECEKRRLILNTWSDKAFAFIAKITCPCWWRKAFNRNK